MRKQGAGTIVNIISDAGLAASPKAGPAYVMSQVRPARSDAGDQRRGTPRGIRACALLPGDIDTPLLDRRPTPRRRGAPEMLTPEDVAECVMLAINLPPRATVEELLVRPT